MSHHKIAIKTAWLSLIINIILALFKWGGGILGNSYALIADATETTVDIFCSLFVLLGVYYMLRPADDNHPYGHGKMQALVTFLIVEFLCVSSFLIIYHSLSHLGVERAPPKVFTLYILGAVILFQEISYRVMLHNAVKTNSSVLKAEAWHHRGDMITSVLAFFGILIALVLGPGYEIADNIAALCAALYILYNGYSIFRPALSEVMDEHVHHDLVELIQKTALEVAGVQNTEKCFVRKSGMQFHVDLHARVVGDLTVREGHTIAHRLKDYLKAQIPELASVLIHIEPQ